ncbi:protein of unknown function [Methylorubrum extorquens]|uniref:Uncharacterized protein n=1 Tax=Methylorubrum extorquens TaxID=408 RepID=A0A2N9AQS4_METEX|nr:protein of unknown function [Methylorubrum extorquens]
MARLDAAGRDAAAPPRPSAAHGGRPGEPARCARDVSRDLALPHPRHQRAAHDRAERVLGLHPHDERGRDRPLRAHPGRHPRRGHLTSTYKSRSPVPWGTAPGFANIQDVRARSGPVVVAAIAEVAAEIIAATAAERGVLEAAIAAAERRPEILIAAAATKHAATRLTAGQTRRRSAAELGVSAGKGIGERAAEQHAARCARRHRQGRGKEAAACGLLRLAAPGSALRSATIALLRAALRTTIPALLAVAALLAPSLPAGTLRLGTLSAAEDARQEPTAAGRLRLSLLAGLFELLVEALDRLFLHVDELRHGVGRVGLVAKLLGDEALRIGVAGLSGRLFEPLEDAVDDVAFFAVHGAVSLRRRRHRDRAAARAVSDLITSGRRL